MIQMIMLLDGGFDENTTENPTLLRLILGVPNWKPIAHLISSIPLSISFFSKRLYLFFVLYQHREAVELVGSTCIWQVSNRDSVTGAYRLTKLLSGRSNHKLSSCARETEKRRVMNSR